MTKYRIDYLKNHKDWKVCQGYDMYHFNSDTCFLGEFIEIENNDRVLDVGTNNGALLVYAAKKAKCKLYGIDINKKALKYAKKTMKINHIKACFYHKDFSSYKNRKKFDIIIANPPYFDSKDEKEKNINENIKMARHEHFLTLKSLFYSFDNNLKQEGRIFMVHRPSRLNDIKREIQKYDFAIETQKDIFNEKGKNITVLLKIVRKKK